MTAARTEYFTFQLGPVQSFIESARTVRDLWTGSFILSWLTVTALKKAEGEGAETLSPDNSGDRLRRRCAGWGATRPSRKRSAACSTAETVPRPMTTFRSASSNCISNTRHG